MAGRALSEGPDAEIAIMMVEAGGTEDSWAYYEAGAPKVTEEVLAGGLEAAKKWIRESIELQRELVNAAGPKATIAFEVQSDYGDDVYEQVVAVGTDAVSKACTIIGKSERNAAIDEATNSIIAELSERVRRPDRRDQSRRQVAHQGDRPQADRRGRRQDRRTDVDRHPAAQRRGWTHPDGTWLGAVRAGRDAGAERDDSRNAAHGPDARHDRHRRLQALHAPLQLPAVLHGRDGFHERPEAARDRPRTCSPSALFCP